MADLIVEDGTGLPDANSYASVADADNYLSVRPNYDAWDNFENQENYLMWATRLLDQRATFYGYKQVANSALRWPRTGVVDRDGLAVPYDEVPLAIKHAVIEIAMHLFTQNVDPSTPISTSGEIKRVKADVLEVEYFENTARATTNYFPVGINEILRGYGSLNSGTGSRFARISRV